jgi:hypothetical protein
VKPDAAQPTSTGQFNRAVSRNPDRLDIKCPQCGSAGVFVEPFGFPAEPPADRPSHRWGSWDVVERYPQLLPWQAPRGSANQFLTDGPGVGGYRLLHKGVVECAGCKAPFVHTLAWPDDAWWQWSIRGKMLWAWNRAHAQQILAYVRATDRPARSTHGPLGSIPSHFLSAKVRDLVARSIERKLAAT